MIISVFSLVKLKFTESPPFTEREGGEITALEGGWTSTPSASQTLVGLARIDSTLIAEESLLALQDKRRNKRVTHHFCSFLKKVSWFAL